MSDTMHMNAFSPGKKDVTDRGKTGPRFWGIRFFPAEAGLSQAWPWPPGGTHSFFPAAGWPRDARGPASLFDKIPNFALVL